jgi:IS1 family transposase
MEKCRRCGSTCVKNGIIKGGYRYRCKSCGRSHQSNCAYKACQETTDSWIIRLNRECCGIRSISRLLGISKTTVISRIKKLADGIRKPLIFKGKTYEVDELRTYIRKKSRQCWVCMAVEKASGQVVDISVGRRTKKTLGKVVDTLKLSEARKVYTDGLEIYKSLLPKEQHVVKPYQINKVERKNLHLRNSMKRLTRKTICYSKSKVMLEASVKLCLWADPRIFDL